MNLNDLSETACHICPLSKLGAEFKKKKDCCKKFKKGKRCKKCPGRKA